jgi:predicted phosphodiesterase
MRIRFLSDLHLEFMSPLHQSEFVRRLPNDCDVLVLAGDIAGATGLKRAFGLFSRHFAGSTIIFVAGNHEFYGSSPGEVEDSLCPSGLPDNVHALEMGTVRVGSLGLDGQRFLGCTLWFPPPQTGDKLVLTDYSAIEDFEPWVYERNAKSVQWLADNVRSGDVVVTHHLPSHKSVHKMYAGNPQNDFFVCDMTKLIEERQPALWIHGHTHESCDYQIGATRVVCNPYGYFPSDTNNNFDPSKTVEIT